MQLFFPTLLKTHNAMGVVESDHNGKSVSIEEKRREPKSSYAVPDVYIYDNDVVEFERAMKLSARGELEITDVNLECLRRGKPQDRCFNRGVAWLDAGTITALQEASG